MRKLLEGRAGRRDRRGGCDRWAGSASEPWAGGGVGALSPAVRALALAGAAAQLAAAVGSPWPCFTDGRRSGEVRRTRQKY